MRSLAWRASRRISRRRRWAQELDGRSVSAEPMLRLHLAALAQNYMGEASVDDFFLNVEPRRLSYFTFDWRRDCSCDAARGALAEA